MYGVYGKGGLWCQLVRRMCLGAVVVLPSLSLMAGQHLHPYAWKHELWAGGWVFQGGGTHRCVGCCSYISGCAFMCLGVVESRSGSMMLVVGQHLQLTNIQGLCGQNSTASFVFEELGGKGGHLELFGCYWAIS